MLAIVATVLVIEDNPANLKLARLVLGSAGYAVLMAESAEAGIALVREQLPDLVLMDIRLPDMDGITATRLLKSDPATAPIPLIALTAFAMKGDEERIRVAGCDGYLSKPYRFEELLAMVERFVAPT